MLWKKLLGAGGLVGGDAPPAGGITFVNEVSGVVGGATTTTDVTLPASLAEGDVLVFMIAADYNFATNEPTDPIDLDISRDGWFNLFASEDSSLDGYIYGLVCGASPPTTVRVRGSAASVCDAPYVCQAWRGVDARVFDARSSNDYTTGSSASPNPPSVTTVTDDALVIAFMMLDDDDDTVSTWPTGYTNQIEKNTGNGLTSNSATVAMSSKLVTTAGAENPAAYTMAGAGDQWVTCSIALQPDQTEVSTWAITEVGREIYNSADAGTTFTLPTVLEDDYVLIFSGSAGGQYGSGGTPMNSSGWTLLESSSGYRYVWGKVMGATPDTSVDIDDPLFSQGAAFTIVAFRGVDTTTPQDVAASFSASATDTCPAITTATNNALVIRYRDVFSNFSYGMSEWPIGYGGFNWSTAGQFGNGSFALSLCYTQQDTAGSTGTETIRSSDTSGNDFSATMALRPA